MSGTVMKFGPQWIRTLTDGGAPSSQTASQTAASSNSNAPQLNANNNNNSNSNSSTNSISNSTTSNSSNNGGGGGSGGSNVANNNINQHTATNNQSKIYKLADYRYGREEMLALYDPNTEASDDVKKFTDLYVDKARMPLSMTPMTEEEIKLTARNWNSEVGLRTSSKASAATASSISVASSGTAGGGGSLGSGALSSNLGDRQLSDRAGPGGTAPIGALASSPRGPPGSLSRVPLDQRGALSSVNSRGPAARNLVGRGGPNSYVRSQYDDEGLEESAGSFESRFSSLSGQARQNLRARFEPNSRTVLGTKPSDPNVKLGAQVEGDLNLERRSVFERLPNKFAPVDDKSVRKDINGRPIQSNDWRSREWAGAENRSSKFPSEGDRSWRTRNAGEDWRGNSTNPTANWYVKSDEQRNIRTGVQSQDNMGLGAKRDTVRRPSGSEKLVDGDDHDTHPRRRRDSIPEWSVGDPLSGDKVGSFDATGAFREATRDDGSDINYSSQDSKRSIFENYKSSTANSSGNEHDWRLKNQNSASGADGRDLNGVNNTIDFNEFEKLSLIDRNSIPNHDKAESASNESSINSANRGEQNREFAVLRDSMAGNKADFQNRTSPSASNDPKKSSENSRNSASPHSCQRMINQQQLPSNLQQLMKKQPNQAKSGQHQQQSLLSALISGGTATEDDGFAHLERAAEIMVAEWTAEEDHTESANPSASGYNIMENQNRKQQQHDAQVNMAQNHNDARSSNQAQQQQKQQSAVELQQALNPAFDANNHKKFVLLPINHEDAQQWFYRDTQGVIQGPFNATEMFEWYKANYFVKELLVRRACDEIFYPLGEVMKMWDRIPFAPIPANVPPPPPITAQALLQFRAVTKQLELAAGLNPTQSQIPSNAFGLSHPAAVILPLQVPTALAGPQDQQQTGIRYILGAQQPQQQQQQHDQNMAQRRTQQQGNMFDQNEMQAQLRQLLAQLKDREGFSSLNAQEQQEVLVRQYVASRNVPQRIEEQQQVLQRLREQQLLFNGGRFGQMRVDQEEFLRLQQREFQQRQLELQQQQKREEAEKQERLIMEHRMRAEEEKQRIMDEHHKKQKEQENEKQRREFEAEKERQRLSLLKQQQLAKQQEEFRQQMQTQQQRIQQQQQEKKQQQQLQQQQQQQQVDKAKKGQQDQQRKTAWSTVGKPEQEPVSLATLQKLQEEEKERQRQLQQQQSLMQSNQQLQQQLQRQMTWANAAQQPKAAAPIKTLAEIQKEEEERLAREKQKEVKVQPVVPNAGVWNNAASHLNWKNPSGGNAGGGKNQSQIGNAATAATNSSNPTTLVGTTLATNTRGSRKNRTNSNSNSAQVQF